MTESTRNLAVGFFVVSSLVVLATLMAWFGEAPDWLGTNEWTLEIVGTREMRGINPGSAVQLNGVEIGRVKDIVFINTARPDRGVIIISRIKDKYSIPQGSTARVYGATLGFGSGRVEIVVDSTMADQGPLPKENAQIIGEMRSIFGEMISKDLVDSFQDTFTNIASFAGEATPAARNLAELLESRPIAKVSASGSELTPNITTAVERLDRLIEKVDAVVDNEEIKGDFQGAIHDIKYTTEQLRHTVEIWRTQSQRISENLNAGVQETKVDLDRNFDKLYAVLENLDNSTQSLAFSLQQVAQGKGTLGMLANDPRLYEAAVLSVQRFGESMTTLNVVLGKVERDGAFTVQTRSGLIQKEIPISHAEPPRP